MRSGRTSIAVAFVVLTLTMTLGTVTISVVDGLLLRPLPFSAPHELVALSAQGSALGAGVPASPQAFFEWSEQNASFESIGAARPAGTALLAVDGVTESLSVRSVTSNLFTVLGVRPGLGRLFGPEHANFSGSAVAVLSHDLWVRRFRADPDVIGRQFAFGDSTREVIGVLPAGIWFPVRSAPPDVYVPYIPTPADRSNNRGFSMFVVGRLRSGVSIDSARADLQRVSPAVTQSLHDQAIGPAKGWLQLVMAAVGLLILVSAINIASLLLARAVTRGPSLATLETLGAPRRQLAIGLFLEALLLSLSAAGVGLMLSVWGVEVSKALLPADLGRVATLAIDGRVLVATLVVGGLCAVLLGITPAALAARGDLMTPIKTGGSQVVGEWGGRTLRTFLVASVAFVCVLLVMTSLVVTSFIRVITKDLGFDRSGLIAVSYSRSLREVVPAERPAAEATLRRDILNRVRALPGVRTVAMSSGASAPMLGGSVRYGLTIPGIGEVPREDRLETALITANYFDVMGMRVIKGRGIGEADVGAPVMLINDVAAQRFFPKSDPIGQVVTFWAPTTVIGVVGGVSFDGPESAGRPAMYLPIDQTPPVTIIGTSGTLLVRAEHEPRRVAPAVRDSVRSSGAEPAEPRYLDDSFRTLTAGRRLNAAIMAVFGFVALVIGALGIYGTTSFIVARQVRSIGVRLAVGASAAHIHRAVMGPVIWRSSLGIAGGLIGAWALSSTVQSLVFGISATEPWTYAGVALFLLAVSLVAAFVPAVRASRLDPLTALRED